MRHIVRSRESPATTGAGRSAGSPVTTGRAKCVPKRIIALFHLIALKNMPLEPSRKPPAPLVSSEALLVAVKPISTLKWPLMRS